MEEGQLLSEGCVALLKHVFGDDNWGRWVSVMERSQHINSQEFVTWLLDMAEDGLDRMQNEAVYQDTKPAMSSNYFQADYHEEPAKRFSGSHNMTAIAEPEVEVVQESSSSQLTDGAEVNQISFYHETGNFYCVSCGVSLSDLEVISQHREMRHMGTQLCIDCSCCSQQFLSKEAYVNFHATNLLMSSKQKFVCHICAKPFSTKTNLDSHISVKHQKSTPSHVCPACYKKFRYGSGLSAHKKRCPATAIPSVAGHTI